MTVLVIGWNNSIIRGDHSDMWEYVAASAMHDARKRVTRPLLGTRYVPNLWRQRELYRADRRITHLFRHDQLYDVLNAHVLNHIPPEMVRRYIGSYTKDGRARKRFDRTVQWAVGAAKQKGLRRAVVVSNVYERGMRNFLNERVQDRRHDDTETIFPFDDVFGSRLEPLHDGSRIEPRMRTREQRLETLKEATEGFEPSEIRLLINNSSDHPCIEYVLDHGGRVASSSMADADAKENVREKGGIVIESYGQLVNFLSDHSTT